MLSNSVSPRNNEGRQSERDTQLTNHINNAVATYDPHPMNRKQALLPAVLVLLQLLLIMLILLLLPAR
jgi:hypothetical protein